MKSTVLLYVQVFHYSNILLFQCSFKDLLSKQNTAKQRWKTTAHNCKPRTA